MIVDRQTAMTLSAVWAAVRLLSSAVSRMPVDILRSVDGIPAPASAPRWLRRPVVANPNLTRIDHFAQVMTSVLLDGNAFVLTIRDDSGDVSELVVLDPREVEVAQNSDLSPRYIVGTSRTVYGWREILHILLQPFPGMLRGMSPVESARNVFGSGLAAQEYGNRFFGQAATPSGVIQVPAGSKVTIDELKEGWVTKHTGLAQAHTPGVLTGGAEWKPMSITNEQAQFLGSRQFSVAEVARWYAVPPHMIGDVERSTSWGTGIEQQGIGFVTYSLNDYLVLLEVAYSRIVPAADTYLRFNRNALQRGDFKARVDGYKTLWGIGVLNADEILALEDRPPQPNGMGQKYYIPLNYASVGVPRPEETG
jgi:HK97 family phage portal protein